MRFDVRRAAGSRPPGGNQCGRDRQAESARPSGSPAGAMVEVLEARVLLSGHEAPRVDAGDFYWGDGERIPLLRATDEVVLGLFPTSARRARRLVAAVTSDAGGLAGYSLVQTLTPSNFLLKRSDRLAVPGYRSLLRRVSGLPALKHLTPTFFAPGASRSSVIDAVSVKLADGVPPAQVFGPEYSGWELVAGRYVASLARGGGIDALKAAAGLHENPFVANVDPHFFFDIIPW